MNYGSSSSTNAAVFYGFFALMAALVGVGLLSGVLLAWCVFAVCAVFLGWLGWAIVNKR